MEQKQQKKQNVKEELIKRDIIVKDDGSVTLTDDIRYVVDMDARDFLSFVRQQEDAIKNIDNLLTEERKKLMIADRDKMQGQLKLIAPYLEESEKKFTIHNKKIELENKTKAVEHILSKTQKERNVNFLYGVLQNLKDGEYIELLNGLSKESYRVELRAIMHALRKKVALKK